MFHALSGAREADAVSLLAELADREPFGVQVTGVRQFGKGVAYDLRAEAAEQIHGRVRRRFADDLTRQDAQRLKLHVTVANKLDPADAKALFGELEAQFHPFDASAVALSLHRYQGGPWQLVERWPLHRR
jgi:2'-5' RNA ligase